MNDYLTAEERLIADALRDCPESSLHMELPRRAPLTLHQVGVLQGITRERVRQIELRALKKLKAKLAMDESLCALLMQMHDTPSDKP